MRRSTGRLNMALLFATAAACVAGLVFAPAVATAEELEQAILRARAAVEDGLFDLALRELQPYAASGADASDLGNEAFALSVEALARAERYDRALERISNAAPPLAAPLVYWKAFCEYSLGKAEAARTTLQALDPEKTEGVNEAALLRLHARVDLALSDTERAWRLLEVLCERYPHSPEMPDALLDWGRSLLNAGETEEAADVLERLSAMPADLRQVEEGTYLLGLAWIRLEREVDAVALLESLSSREGIVPGVRADALLAAASGYELLGEMSNAVHSARQALSRAAGPQQVQAARQELGRLLLQNGVLDESLPLLKAFVVESPTSTAAEPTQFALAQALLDAGRTDEAVTEFQNYLEAFTNTQRRALAYEGKGWALMDLERYAEAALAFRRAAEVSPVRDDKRANLFKVGDAYFSNGQYSLAEETYREWLGLYPEAPLTPQARYQLAESLARGGKTREAREMFSTVATTWADSELGPQALLRAAEVDRAEGNWLAAMEGFDKLMRTYPEGRFYVDALHQHAMVLYKLLRFTEALEEFERVMDRFPASSQAEQAFYMRGMCYYWTGQDEKAKQISRAFLQRHPDSKWAPDVLFWLGTVNYNHGDYVKSQSNCMQFVKEFPGHVYADDALLRAGLSASRRKEYLQAIDILAGLAKDYPESDSMAMARFAQADALTELGRFAEAILIFDEITTRYPESDVVERAWMRKGDCQFTLGQEDPDRYRESLESYRVVAKSSRASLDLVMQALYKVGRTWEKMGLTDKALEQYYNNVIVRYLEDRDKGIWHNETAKVWFTRAAFNAAGILETRKDWRAVVKVLERVVDAGVPGVEDARDRIARIRSEHWWLFY